MIQLEMKIPLCLYMFGCKEIQAETNEYCVILTKF
jgi:hypothetical protein